MKKYSQRSELSSIEVLDIAIRAAEALENAYYILKRKLSCIDDTHDKMKGMYRDVRDHRRVLLRHRRAICQRGPSQLIVTEKADSFLGRLELPPIEDTGSTLQAMKAIVNYLKGLKYFYEKKGFFLLDVEARRFVAVVLESEADFHTKILEESIEYLRVMNIRLAVILGRVALAQVA